MNEQPAPEANSDTTITGGEDEAREVGVGPWPGPWPDGDHYDPGLLADGDRAQTWSTATGTGVVRRSWPTWTWSATTSTWPWRNWSHDFNIGSVVRTANAFGCAAVHIVGKRRWNRRGAMVTDRYQHVHHHPDTASLVAWGGRTRPDADRRGTNLPGAVPLETYPLPRNAVLVFGQRARGCRRRFDRCARRCCPIAQFGFDPVDQRGGRRGDRPCTPGSGAHVVSRSPFPTRRPHPLRDSSVI